MIKRNRVYLFLLLGVLACFVMGVSLGCGFIATERESTPTQTIVIKKTATPTRTATETLLPSPTPTRTRLPSATPTSTPLPTATPTALEQAEPTLRPPANISMQDPSPEELSEFAYNLLPGDQFTLVLTEQYVTDLAGQYVNEVDLPIEVQDVVVDFTPEQVRISAKVPLSFFRVEVTLTGVWRAVDCKFEADVLSVRVAGQSAPASLRKQIESAIDDALQASSNLLACFTAVELSDDRVTLRGYRP